METGGERKGGGLRSGQRKALITMFQTGNLSRPRVGVDWHINYDRKKQPPVNRRLCLWLQRQRQFKLAADR